MNETEHFLDSAQSLLPRSLEPALPKAEDSPELTEKKPYQLTADDQSAHSLEPASADYGENPLLKIVEAGMDANVDPAVRKVPDDQRSKVGTVGPLIT